MNSNNFRKLLSVITLAMEATLVVLEKHAVSSKETELDAALPPMLAAAPINNIAAKAPTSALALELAPETTALAPTVELLANANLTSNSKLEDADKYTVIV